MGSRIELAQQLAVVGDDLDVQVGDQQGDAYAGMFAADADMVEAADHGTGPGNRTMDRGRHIGTASTHATTPADSVGKLQSLAAFYVCFFFDGQTS